MQKSVLTVICSAVVLITSFLIYSKTADYGFILDDRIAITENSIIMKGAESYGEVFKTSFYAGANNKNKNVYRPLTSLSFAYNVESQDLGPRDVLNPKPFRAFNLFLHSITCVLLFLLLYQELFKDNLPLALIITLIFVVHPIHTEVVANIKSRDELLGLFGVVGSMLLFLKGVRLNKPLILLGGYIIFAIGVFSKESVITFVAIIPLAWYFFNTISLKRILILTVPLVLIAVSYIMIRSEVLGTGIATQQSLIQNALVETDGLAERLPTNFVMFGKYLSLLTWPSPLSADYSYNEIPVVGWGNIGALISILFHLMVCYFVVRKFKSKDPIVFAILLYYISLSVVSNVLFLIGAQFAERFVFIPSIGYCIALGVLLERGARFIPQKTRERTLYSVAGIIVITYALMTNYRNDAWESIDKLHLSTLKAAPNSARSQYNYAATFFNKANKTKNKARKDSLYRAAQTYYSRATEICPSYGTAWYYLGDSYFNSGDTSKAWSCYVKYIDIEGPNARTYNTMGVIKGMRGQLDSSQYYLNESVQLEPEYGEACANLGKTHIQKGLKDTTTSRLSHFKQAKVYLNKAVTAKFPPPDLNDIKLNLNFVNNEIVRLTNK